MDPKIFDLKLENQQSISDYTYDCHNNSLFLINQSKLTEINAYNNQVIEENNVNFNQSQNQIANQKEQQDDKFLQINQLNPTTLRFYQPHSHKDLIISPSGMIATCTSDQEQYAVGNLGFSSGVHYWEVLCPNNCEGIQIGVIKSDFLFNSPNKASYCLIQFKTTTSREVGLKLDLINNRLMIWLNGHYYSKRTQILTPGTYYPAVKITGAGNHVVLNPFAQDPEDPQYQFRLIDQVDEPLESKKKQETAAIFQEILQLKEPKKAEHQVNDHAKKQEIHYLKGSDQVLVINGDNLKLIRRDNRGKFNFDYHLFDNKPQDIKDQVFISLNFSDLQTLIKTLDWDQLVGGRIFCNDEARRVFEAFKNVQRNNAGNQVHAKLIYEDAKAFTNAVSNWTLREIQQLIEKLNPNLKPEKVAIQSNQPNQQQQIQLPQLPKNENKALQFIEEDLALPFSMFTENDKEAKEQSIEQKKVEQEKPKVEEVKQEEPVIAFIDSLYPSKEFKQQHLSQISIDSLYEILNIIYNIDEQLYAMTLHTNASRKLANLASNQGQHLRIFSSFSRLSSLLGYSNTKYSLVELAEHGIYNQLDQFVDLRHYLQQEVVLEKLENIRNKVSLSRNLKEMLPQNRMFKGLSHPNVELSSTLNSLPARSHRSGGITQQIDFIRPKVLDDTNIIVTASKDGSVNIWNTELSLSRLNQSNIKEDINSLGIKQAPVNQEAQKTVNEPEIFKLFEEALDQAKNVKKPSVVYEEAIIPDPSLMEYLYSMGFPLDIVKKSLIQTKNVGAPQAIDVILQLLSENGGQTESVDKKKDVQSSATRLKGEWCCPSCTFLNESTVQTCSMCESPAPLDAYLSEADLIRQEEQAKRESQERLRREQREKEEKLLEEQKIQQEQLEKSRQEEELRKSEEAQKAIAKKSCLENSEVSSLITIIVKSNRTAPIVIGAGLNNQLKDAKLTSIYRLRRFGYNQNYLQQFYKKADTCGFVCSLNHEWLPDQSPQTVEQTLLRNESNRFIIEALEPQFQYRASTEKFPKEQIFVPVGEHDIIFPNNQFVVDSHWRRINYDQKAEVESYKLSILTSNAQKTEFTFNIYTVKINSFNFENQFTISDEQSFKVSNINLAGAQLYYTVNENLYIVTSDAVFSCDNNGQIKTLHQLEKQKIVSSQESQKQIILLKTDQNHFIVADWDPEGTFISREKQSKLLANKSDPNQAQLTNFSVDSLNGDDIFQLQQLLSTKYIGSSAEGQIYSGQFDPKNQLNTLHKWRGHRQNYTITFPEPTSLLNLKISLQSETSGKYNEKLKEEIEKRSTNAGLNQIKKSDLIGVEIEQKQDKQVAHQISNLPIFTLAEQEDQKSSGAQQKNSNLHLFIESFKGAAYNQSFVVSKILLPTNEVFVSNYPRTSFVFTHLHEKQMVVESVTVGSGLSTLGGGFPIGQGLIFTTNSLSFLSQTSQFDGMQHEAYQDWLKQRKQVNIELEQWEPVGSFKFEATEQITFELDFKRPCRYILLKPTQFRKIPKDFTSYFAINPIEIKQFTASGFIIDDQVESEKSQDNNSLVDVINSFATDNLNIEVNTGSVDVPIWEKLPDLKNVMISYQEIVNENYFDKNRLSQGQLQVLSNELNELGLPYNLLTNLKISHKQFKQSTVSQIRVSFTQGLNQQLKEGSRTWTFKTISLQAEGAFDQINSKINEKAQTNQLFTLPSSVLREFLLDLDKYSKFNQILVKQLTNSNSSIDQRKNISKLLGKLMNQNSKLTDMIFQDLSLKEYIILNVLKEKDSTFLEVYQLLKQFLSNQNFPSQLFKNLLEIMPLITSGSVQVSPVGLKGYFSLLTWCQGIQPDKCFTNIIEELTNISKRINEIRIPEYNIMRSQYHLANLSFEKELFSDFFNNLVYNDNEQRQLIKQKRKNISSVQQKAQTEQSSIKKRIIMQKNYLIKKFYIDLLSTTTVKEIKIAFDKVEKNEQFSKCKVQIWAVEADATNPLGYKKNLIHHRNYLEYNSAQLHIYAYRTDILQQIFPDQESQQQFCMIGFNNVNVNTRYLIIQISKTLQPFTKTVKEGEKISEAQEIIPEVYGEQLHTANSAIPQIESLFPDVQKQDQFVFLNQYQVGSSAKHDKYSLTGVTPIQFLYDSTGMYKVFPGAQPLNSQGDSQGNSQPIENLSNKDIISSFNSQEQKLKEKLTQLQVQLNDRLRGIKQNKQKMESEEAKEKEPDQDVYQISEEISLIQSQIAEIQNQKRNISENDGFVNLSQSLDFYYTLVYKYSQLLRKIDSSQIKDQASEKISISRITNSSWRQIESFQKEKGRDICCQLFEQFVVYEDGPIRSEILTLLTDCLVDNLEEKNWQQFIFSIIKNYLSTPVSIKSVHKATFSQVKIIEALNRISVPIGELISYLIFKLKLDVNLKDILSFKQTQTSPKKHKSEEQGKNLCMVSSILILLINSMKQLPSPSKLYSDQQKKVHQGAYCSSCLNNQFIVGTRLKCLNCANVDLCSNPLCEQKHLITHPNHVFAVIDEPLPFAPDKNTSITQQPLKQALFDFAEPYTDVHDHQCEKCNKPIVGVRFMCGNCEDYSLCKACYQQDKNHIKKVENDKETIYRFHVFVKLDKAVNQNFKSTPKALFKYLDPLLYPIRQISDERPVVQNLQKKMSKGVTRELESRNLVQSGEEEIVMPGLKRSMSQPVKEAKVERRQNQVDLGTIAEEEENIIGFNLIRLDHEESLRVVLALCLWICDNQEISELDKINTLHLSLDLLNQVMGFASQQGIKEIIDEKTESINSLTQQSSDLFRLLFSILRLGSLPLQNKFKQFLDNLINPKNAPKLDEASFNKLKQQEKQSYIQEKESHEQTKIILIYNLQIVLQWMLDFALNEQTKNPYQAAFADVINQNTWLEHISFILEYLLLAAEKQVSGPTVKQLKQDNQDGNKLKKKMSIKDKEPSFQSQQQQFDSLVPIGLVKSMSMPMGDDFQDQSIQKQKISDYIDRSIQDKQTTISNVMVNNFIVLLNPDVKIRDLGFAGQRERYNFSQSPQLWSLVLKSILKVKVSQLIEARIFQSLVSAFLQAQEEIQQTIFSEVLLLTQNMINQQQYQKELCNTVLTVLFNTMHNIFGEIERGERKQKELKGGKKQKSAKISISGQSQLSTQHHLLKGWLDILLTKSTPKPDDFYLKPFEKAFCKLNPQGAFNLFSNVTKFLINYANVGGREGAQLANEAVILKLSLADDLMRLLIYSESTQNVFALTELFSNIQKYDEKVFSENVQNILTWYLLNKTTEIGISPATDYIKSISDQIMRLFTIVSEHEQVSKIFLQNLIISCKNVDQVILKLSKSQQMSCFTSLTFNQRNCKILEELLDLWVTNDYLATHVSFKLKGFEYLLDRMGISKMEAADVVQKQEQLQKVQNSSNDVSLLEGSDIFEFIQNHVQKEDLSQNKTEPQKPQASGAQSVQLIQSSSALEELKEDELATKVTILPLNGQVLAAASQDWSAHKKGNKGRVLFFNLTMQYYSEFILLIQLDKTVEMKNIKIGFNTVWTDYSDKILGIPTSILLEGGLTPASLQPLGTLQLLNDEGYSQYGVKVFGKNFQQFSSSDQPITDLESQFKTLGFKRVNYLRFRFRRPIATMVENLSFLSGKMYKNISVAISFLSVSGFEVGKLPINVRSKIIEQQESSALQVIGKLCNQTFSDTLQQLANDQTIVEKIKGSFDVLTNLLVPHESWLSPVFLAIASHNSQMADWIIEKFLSLQRSQQHAKMICDIILSHSTESFSRIQTVFEFVLREAGNVSKLGNSNEALIKFNQLSPFIETIMTVLRISSSDYQTNSQENKQELRQLQLKCTEQNIRSILELYDNNNSSQSSKLIIKLLIGILFIPQPFQISEEKLLISTLNQIWQLLQDQNKSHFYEMLAPIIIGSQDAVDWLLSNNSDKLKKIFLNLITKFESIKIDRSHNISKLIKNSLQILISLSCIDQIKQIVLFNKWILTFYKNIRISDAKNPQLLKDIDQEILSLIIDWIKQVILGDEVNEKDFAETIISDIDLLSTKRDILYVTNFLVPILNAEGDVPVCLHPFDHINKKWLTDIRKILAYMKKQQLGNMFNGANPNQSQITSNPQGNSQFGELFSSFSTKVKGLSDNSDKNKIALLTQIKNFTEKTNQYKNLLQKSYWQLAFTSFDDACQQNAEDVHQKVLKNAPFLFIQEGTNDGNYCVIGAYISQSIDENYVDLEYEKQYRIPKAEDCFAFYYDSNGTQMHFPLTPNQKGFVGALHEFTEDGGGFFCVYHTDSEKFYVNFQAGSQSSFDLYGMKPVEENMQDKANSIASGTFSLIKQEFWILKPLQNSQAAKDRASLTGSLLSNLSNQNLLFANNYFSATNPQNYFRATPVYNLPSNINLNKLLEMINVNGVSISPNAYEQLSIGLRFLKDYKINQETDLLKDLNQKLKSVKSSNYGIIDIEFDAQKFFESAQMQKISTQMKSEKSVTYAPLMRIFDAFEKSGGVQKIIGVILESLKNWKNKDKAERWRQFVEELSSFSTLPHFFGLFMKNKECVELLFQLLAGAPDDAKDPKKWEEQEQKAVRFNYQVLSDVFRVDNTAKIRDIAIEYKFIDTILNRIGLISKEKKRKWVDNFQEEEDKKDKVTLKKTEVKTLPGQSKGVMYGTDQDKKWNVNEFFESKKNKSEQLLSLLEILETFLDFKNWEPPQKLLDAICESSLLPLLETTYSTAMLDLAKEPELSLCQIRITKVLTKHRSLIPCLLPLDEHYQPKQLQSIYDLLINQHKTANTFLVQIKNQNQKDDSNKEAQSTQKIAQELVDTFQLVDKVLRGNEEPEDEQQIQIQANQLIQEILQMPMPEAYKLLLKDLRFDYMDMKDTTGKYKHHYSNCIQPNYTPSMTKMIRLASETADLAQALPYEHTNGIYCRCDKDRVDVMKAMVMGAKGTPYAHGAFVFDIYFEDNYPNGPPKCNLETTGGGKVRFNPNLYACGKVCLSLLGTWRGNATENWDAKLSTLMQVLISVQAIIMSEAVYFNEPGFEGEANSTEGQRKNEAYQNIVKYANIKYAMIDNIKNPPKGFESVIKRHFYLKKAEILEDVAQWVKQAETSEASYVSLVNDHNNHWCSEFKKSKKQYYEMMKEAQKELETELNKLQAPNASDIHSSLMKKKVRKIKAPTAKKAQDQGQIGDINDIDVKYEDNGKVNQKSFDIQDEAVKDRWSRYIGAMGLDAVNKQSNSSVFLSGLGPLGVEIAKNIVLSGVKRFTMHDEQVATLADLSGQFFISQDDVNKKKNRVASCIQQISELNYYVKVDSALLDKPLPCSEEELDKIGLNTYTLVILTQGSYKQIGFLNEYCRKHNVKLISTEICGVFAKIFNDFGKQFSVLDKNGEEPQEVMIKNITVAEKGVVTLLQGVKHNYQDGDIIVIDKVEGMAHKTQLGKSINLTQHKIQVINSNSFYIEDTRDFGEYERNGLAKNLKIAVKVDFRTFNEIKNEKRPPFDAELLNADFAKYNNPRIMHVAFAGLDKFRETHKRLPQPWHLEDCNEFVKLAQENLELTFEAQEIKENAAILTVLRQFALTCSGNFPPLVAFIGGFVSQEAIKSITNKYMPVNQLFYTDAVEVLPDLPEKFEDWVAFIKGIDFKPSNQRSDSLKICVGPQLLDVIQNTKLFMIGCGAIGCELLKNYSMLNLGTGKEGLITITDPDHIETSNLNRQFLFREKHLRKPKSVTAAAQIIQMNNEMKSHIVARLDKVHEGTANIFSDKFFEDLTIVTNALDNVQARRYVDLRCVAAKTPLIESGTLGPKGHVQVIIPYQTESYGSSQDPAEEGDIPFCTLKMFPEETLHCVEWAREKFGKLFTLKPKSAVKIVEDPNYKPQGTSELKALREVIKLIKTRPINFSDCIRYARFKFQKYYTNDIKQLIYTYPLDYKTKEGKLFWTMPKRPPGEQQFDPKNQLHANFITSLAVLRAKIYKIPFPKDFRNKQEMSKIAEEASLIKVPEFKPSEEKAKAISSQVDKDASKEEKKEEEVQEEKVELSEADTLMKEYEKLKQQLSKEVIEGKNVHFMYPEEFEKDEDTNGHIDFIYTSANCRSLNYKLENMDWLTVKLKAGRIVPALATTTAAISGLQTIEVVKVLKKCKVDLLKNVFLNLAIPLIQLTEPGPVPKIKLHENFKVTVTLWDRWEVYKGADITLKQIYDELGQKYQLIPMDTYYGAKPIYIDMQYVGKDKERESALSEKLQDILEVDVKETNYVDITISFKLKKEGEYLKGTPNVRIHFVENKQMKK